ncbi:MAG: hypothetical protein JXM71_03645 [Spirochaetales bacterium]|nr:hypothetical protein [Spirochaetales bacterium]
MKKIMAIIIAASLVASAAFAEDESAGLDFQAGISLGTDVLVDASGETETWNSLGFQPDLALGPFGLGFDFTLHFKLMPNPDTALEIFPGDWLPDYEGSGKNLLDLYLPKIMYVRYGQRGAPLFAKLGSIDDLTLGNGFIVGSYSNTKFLPSQRIFGLDVGVDGTLFDFPYVGVELLTGNLARFDVIGGRLFARPLVSTGLPLLEDLQVGATVATDRLPELYSDTASGSAPVTVYGADIFMPVIKSEIFPLAAFTELAFEPEGRSGFMVGAGGRLAGVITYGAQLRLLGAGFLPVYFDANYDLFRADKAALMETAPTGDGFAGWLAKAGASLFEDKLYFDVSVDGPFKAIPVDGDSAAEYPHLRGVVGMTEGIIGGFFVNGSYDKYFLGKANGFFADLVDPNDAVISASFNYKTGAAVFTLLYNLTYNPDSENGFDVTSSLQSSIKF